MKQIQRVVDVGEEAEQLSFCFSPSYFVTFNLESAQLDLFEWGAKWKARRLMEHQDIIRRLASGIIKGWDGAEIRTLASKRGAEVDVCPASGQLIVRSRGFTTILSQVNGWNELLSYTDVGEGHVLAEVLP